MSPDVTEHEAHGATSEVFSPKELNRNPVQPLESRRKKQFTENMGDAEVGGHYEHTLS